jgi:hypothetical protein
MLFIFHKNQRFLLSISNIFVTNYLIFGFCCCEPKNDKFINLWHDIYIFGSEFFFLCKISFLHNFIFEIEMLFFPPNRLHYYFFQLFFWMSDKFCLLFVRITAIKNLLIFAILIFLMIEMESDYLLNYLIWGNFF